MSLLEEGACANFKKKFHAAIPPEVCVKEPLRARGFWVMVGGACYSAFQSQSSRVNGANMEGGWSRLLIYICDVTGSVISQWGSQLLTLIFWRQWSYWVHYVEKSHDTDKMLFLLLVMFLHEQVETDEFGVFCWITFTHTYTHTEGWSSYPMGGAVVGAGSVCLKE